MVSLKAIFRCLKCFSLSALFLSVCTFSYAVVDTNIDVNLELKPGLNEDLLLCATGLKKCCVDGKMTCVDESTKLCLTSCAAIIDPIETCGTSGQVQYKPSGSCGTTSRTCCSGGTWSDWDKECPKTCDSSTKPITSQSCGTNGTQTRSVTCDTSTGKWVEGVWGTCKEQVCTPGEVEPCPTNCYQRRTCNSAGTAWSSCACENKDEIWNVTMNYKNTVQSTMTCEAHCCCDGDTPVANVYNKYLNKNAGTGCRGKNGKLEYYCGCKERDSGNQTYYTGTQSQCLR